MAVIGVLARDLVQRILGLLVSHCVTHPFERGDSARGIVAGPPWKSRDQKILRWGVVRFAFLVSRIPKAGTKSEIERDACMRGEIVRNTKLT